MKRKIDPYNMIVGVMYLIVSLIVYSKFGLPIASLFVLMALIIIFIALFKKNSKFEGSRFVSYSYLFVIFTMIFPFVTSIYKNDLFGALFVFLMGIVFFINYLREIKSIKK